MNAEAADPRIAKYRRRRRMLYFLGVVLVATAAWIFRPHFHADPALIDPRLRALEKPYRNVDSDVIFDGGSIRMNITDAIGHSEYFFIPNDKWQTVYFMPDPKSFRGHIPASNHAATLQELAAILSDHCDEWEDYENLTKMTGRLSDRVKTFCSDPGFYISMWWEKLKL
jgi:hypothetical protein